MKYILDRLKEASTWRGFVALAASLGITLEPDQIAAIVSVGMGIAGMIGVFTKDRR